MKRIAALTLSLLLILSLAACGTEQDDRVSSAPMDTSATETPTTADDNKRTTTTADTTVSGDVSPTPDGEDDVADILGDMGYEINETDNGDGSVTVELTEKREDVVTPAVPTLPIVKPTKPAAPDTTAKPTTTTAKPTTTTTANPTTTTANPTTTTAKPTTTTTTAKPTTTTTKPTTTTTKPTTTTTTRPAVTRPTYTYTTGQTHTAVPITERYMYTTLNAEQQGWYRTIDRAVRNLEERATFSAKMSENRNYYVYFAYMFDNPELWYLGNTMTLYSLGDGTSQIIFCYSDFDTYCNYGHTPGVITDELRASIRAKDAIFKKAVSDIVSTIPANAPAVVKEKLIYDRILRTSHYNLGARWNGIAEPNWCAYGILVNHYGVCESYAEAFQTLCLLAGINCTGVVGEAGGGHKWNAVQLDGEWYACDITFDDPIGGDPNDAYHYYFNLTTKRMEELRHSTEGSDYPGPQCNGTKYSYQNYFGNEN